MSLVVIDIQSKMVSHVVAASIFSQISFSHPPPVVGFFFFGVILWRSLVSDLFPSFDFGLSGVWSLEPRFPLVPWCWVGGLELHKTARRQGAGN